MIIRLVLEEFNETFKRPIYVDYELKKGEDKSQIIRAMAEKLIKEIEK